MITYSVGKAFGGKVSNIETPSFSCFVSTAKDGLFRKQSTVIWDTSDGFANRELAAKLEYNKELDSNARLGLHDTILHVIDGAGMNGVSLVETLSDLLQRLHKEGIATPSILEAWWNKNVR